LYEPKQFLSEEVDGEAPTRQRSTTGFPDEDTINRRIEEGQERLRKRWSKLISPPTWTDEEGVAAFAEEVRRRFRSDKLVVISDGSFEIDPGRFRAAYDVVTGQSPPPASAAPQQRSFADALPELMAGADDYRPGHRRHSRSAFERLSQKFGGKRSEAQPAAESRAPSHTHQYPLLEVVPPRSIADLVTLRAQELAVKHLVNEAVTRAVREAGQEPEPTVRRSRVRKVAVEDEPTISQEGGAGFGDVAAEDEPTISQEGGAGFGDVAAEDGPTIPQRGPEVTKEGPDGNGPRLE